MMGDLADGGFVEGDLPIIGTEGCDFIIPEATARRFGLAYVSQDFDKWERA